MVWLCSHSSLCLMRTGWHLLLGPRPLSPTKSYVCQHIDPLHCLLNICMTSQLPGLCYRATKVSEPGLFLPDGFSPLHPKVTYPMGRVLLLHWAQGTNGDLARVVLGNGTFAKWPQWNTEQISQSKRYSHFKWNDWRSSVWARRQNAFQMTFWIILFWCLSFELFLLFYSAHLVISSWCVDSKHILSTLMMK